MYKLFEGPEIVYKLVIYNLNAGGVLMNQRRFVIIFGAFIAIVCSIISNSSLANERLLLFDNFSDGSLLNPPHMVNNPIWRAKYWSVPVPIDDGTGNMIIRVNGLSIITENPGETEWEDFEAAIKFKFISQDPNNFYSLAVHLLGNGINKASGGFIYTAYGLFYQITKYNANGEVTARENVRLGAGPGEVFTGSWQTFKVKVVGDKLTGYLDDVEIATHSIGFKDYDGINLHIENKSSPQFDIEHIKVTDVTPVTIAQPSAIAADGDSESIINVNWVPGGRVRILKEGINMFNLDEEPINEAIVSPSGETVFKVRGVIAGEYSLEESLDGDTWWKSQPNEKVIKFISVADPIKSAVYIPDLQEGQKFPAAGEEYPVTVKVSFVDFDEENKGDPGRHKVSLIKIAGGPGSISSPQILNGETEVSFTLTSTESGIVTLEAEVMPVDEVDNPIATIQPVKLKTKVTIIFNQAISPSKSIIRIVDN